MSARLKLLGEMWSEMCWQFRWPVAIVSGFATGVGIAKAEPQLLIVAPLFALYAYWIIRGR